VRVCCSGSGGAGLGMGVREYERADPYPPSGCTRWCCTRPRAYLWATSGGTRVNGVTLRGSVMPTVVRSQRAGSTADRAPPGCAVLAARPLIRLNLALVLGRAGGSTYWLWGPARNEQAGQHGGNDVAHFSVSLVCSGGAVHAASTRYPARRP
jgi:hypothetical protein